MFRRFTSERVRQQRRKRFTVFAVLYTFLILSIVLFVWQLSYASFLQIRTISIEGEKTIAHSDVFAVVRNGLTGTYGHLLSKRNIFLYPRRAIQQEILATFPSVKKVSVSAQDRHTLSVRIEERKGVAVVCPLIKTPGTDTSQECYFLDTTAFAFILAPRFTGSSYVTYEVQMPPTPLGTFIFSSDEFTQLSTFTELLKKVALSSTHVRVDGEEIEVTVTTVGRSTFKLLVKRSVSYADVLRNLETVIESADFQRLVGLNGVDYIDLRFGNKVFYKEKENKVVETLESSTQTTSSELTPL